MPIQYAQLGHVAYLCNDIDVMEKFYIEKLDFRFSFMLNRDDGSPWLKFLVAPSGQFLELFYANYPAKDNLAGQRSFQKFCLEVDDMAAAIQTLHERGVELYSGPVKFGRRMPVPNPDQKTALCGSYCAFLLDPEGNEVEIQQFTPNSLQLR